MDSIAPRKSLVTLVSSAAILALLGFEGRVFQKSIPKESNRYWLAAAAVMLVFAFAAIFVCELQGRRWERERSTQQLIGACALLAVVFGILSLGP